MENLWKKKADFDLNGIGQKALLARLIDTLSRFRLNCSSEPQGLRFFIDLVTSLILSDLRSCVGSVAIWEVPAGCREETVSVYGLVSRVDAG